MSDKDVKQLARQAMKDLQQLINSDNENFQYQQADYVANSMQVIQEILRR